MVVVCVVKSRFMRTEGEVDTNPFRGASEIVMDPFRDASALLRPHCNQLTSDEVYLLYDANAVSWWVALSLVHSLVFRSSNDIFDRRFVCNDIAMALVFTSEAYVVWVLEETDDHCAFAFMYWARGPFCQQSHQSPCKLLCYGLGYVFFFKRRMFEIKICAQ